MNSFNLGLPNSIRSSICISPFDIIRGQKAGRTLLSAEGAQYSLGG
jgi:hypothetical protein